MFLFRSIYIFALLLLASFSLAESNIGKCLDTGASIDTRSFVNKEINICAGATIEVKLNRGISGRVNIEPKNNYSCSNIEWDPSPGVTLAGKNDPFTGCVNNAFLITCRSKGQCPDNMHLLTSNKSEEPVSFKVNFQQVNPE